MDLVEEFIADSAARGLTKHSIESYKSCITDFLRCYSNPTAVGLDELRTYLVDLRRRGLQGNTLKEYFSALSTFYDFLLFEGKMNSNPILGFRKRYLRIKNQHGGENTRQLISTGQMRQLIRLADEDIDILAKTIMLFLAKTGVRRGELISMDVHDLDLERGEFRIKPLSKRSNRLGFLDGELRAALVKYLNWREYRAVNDALWVHSNGKKVARNYVYNMVVRYSSRLGLHDPGGPLCKRFGPHCCRHFFTTMLRRNGMPREFIKELRGDRRKEAVDIYDHIDTEELRRSYLQCVPKLLDVRLPSRRWEIE